MAKKILVIDDHQPTRTILTALLDEVGYQTTVVESGEQAIGVCELENFDLLILGLELPGIDGWETMKRLRSQWKSGMC